MALWAGGVGGRAAFGRGTAKPSTPVILGTVREHLCPWVSSRGTGWMWVLLTNLV